MTKLKRALGLMALTFYGIGLIIGAGIYSVIGAAAGAAREGLWLSFVMGAVVAGLIGLSYAELATAFPQAGAEYVYVRHALPRQRWAPFAAGFVLTVAGTGTAATVALAFAGYLNLFVKLPAALTAFALLALSTLLNIAGISQSSWVNIVFTSIEAIGLLLVIAVGVTAPGFGAAVLARPHTGVLVGAALIFFVYLGFEEIANLAEETKEPARNLPRAIFLSLGVTTALYILVGLAVVALTAPKALAASDSPLAAAMATASPRLASVLGGIALFSTANTALITLIGVSRMLFGMARGDDMPRALARVLAKRRTPWVAALVALAGATVFLPLAEVAVVASLSSFASLLAFVAVHLALIVLRYREPDRERPFRVPFSMGRLPILPVLGILISVALLVQFDRIVYLVGAVTVLAGLGLYAGRQSWSGRHERSSEGPSV